MRLEDYGTPEQDFLSTYGFTIESGQATKITIREVVAALRDNGLPKIENVYYTKDDEGNVTGACALGQIAYNLHADADLLNTMLSHLAMNPQKEDTSLHMPHFHRYLSSFITGNNDIRKMSFNEIADG